MVISLQRWARVTLVMLIVAAVGFVSVSPARALQAPSPVSFPSSTYASALSAPIGSKNDYTGFKSSLLSSPKSVPVKTPALSKPGAGAGNALAVLGTFTGSYWLATQATSEIFDVNTTGDIVCDVQLLWDPTSPCAAVNSPHPEYVPNGDLPDFVPGLAGNTAWQQITTRNNNTVNYQIVDVVENGNSVTLTFAISCSAGEYHVYESFGGSYITAVGIDSNNGVYLGGSQVSGGTLGNTQHNCPSSISTKTYEFNDDAEIVLFKPSVEGPPGISLPVKSANPETRPQYDQLFTHFGTFYYLERSPLREEIDELNSDPDRWWKTDYECWNPVTNATRQLVTNSVRFKESEAQYAPLPDMPCSADEILRSGTITQMGVGEGTKVWEYSMPGDLVEAYQDLPAECVDGSCILDLRRVISGTETVSCFSDPDGCVDWYLNPNKEQLFQCRYNGQQLPLSECIIYKPTFNPSTQTKGETLGDPTTGATPSTADPESELGKDPATVPGVSGEGLPGGPSTQSRECFPTGWGVLNPYEWFVKPMKCLFIPTKPVSTMVSGATQQLTAVSPAIPALPAMGSTPSCPSWKIKIEDYEREILCDTSFGNALRASRPVFAALMITAAGWPFIRSLWYAAIPLLNVTPTATPTSR